MISRHGALRLIHALGLGLFCLSAGLHGQQSELSLRQNFVREVSARIDRELKGFREDPFVESTPLEPVEARWRGLGFIPFARSCDESVYPNSAPRPAERGTGVALFALRGQTVPLVVGLRSLDQPVDSVRLLPEGLSSLDTLARIPAEAISVGVVEYWRVRWGAGSSDKRWRWHPTRIWPFNLYPGDPFSRPDSTGALTVAAGTARAFWVDIRVPEDAAPGKYLGGLELSTSRGTFRFPLELKVLPAGLDPGGFPPAGVIMSGPLDAAACRDLAAHLVSGTSQWYDPKILPLVKERDGLSFDFSLEDAYLRRLSEAGVEGPHLIYAGSSAEPAFDSSLVRAAGIGPDSAGYDEAYALAVQALFEHARKSGWPQLAWGILDRLNPRPGDEKWFATRAATIQRIAGGTVRLVSPILSEGRSAGALRRYVDIWLAGGSTEFHDPASQRILYGYDFCTQRDNAGQARWKVGFEPWRRNLDGVYIWAYNWVGGGHPWDDFDAPVMDWMLSYRDIGDNCIPTPAWEGFRQGVEDRCYIQALLRVLARCPADSPEAVAARRALDRLHQALTGPDADLTGLEMPSEAPASGDSSAAGLARRIIAGYILRLAATVN